MTPETNKNRLLFERETKIVFYFRHADWQGNVAMVTDCYGDVEQHVGYYPYGEPWREPTGQTRLFGGKERMRDAGLNDYDFVARRLNSALALWSTPDPLAQDYAGTNPYVFCAANPVRFIDPSGKANFLTYKNKQITVVGTDGIDDKKVYIVNSKLAKSISKKTEAGQSYDGPVENNEQMAQIPSVSDLEAIETLNEDSNAIERELGMHKSYDGKLVRWDWGPVYDENQPDKPRSITSFWVNGRSVNDATIAEWEVHTHPILTVGTNTGRGIGRPSDGDKISNKNHRKKSFKGTSMVVGGGDKNISFYYKDSIIVTIPIPCLIEFLKKLNRQLQKKQRK